MKPRKPSESDADYIARLEAANDGLRARNRELAAWCGRINEAVTTLSTEGSLAFQAMAEKAGVRAHPSVSAAVRLFDAISHPQWNANKEVPSIDWPDDWEMDGPDVWAGDADMSLNAPIAKAIELLDHMIFHVSGKYVEPIREAQAALQDALAKGVDGVKERAGFKPVTIAPPTEHYRDLDAEQLREMVSGMGWMALDLAQDMHFANFMLRRDLRATTYRRVCSDLYRLSNFYHGGDPGPIDIKVLGGEMRIA
jgi:hypothetical protein